jgi:hypothetical protein
VAHESDHLPRRRWHQFVFLAAGVYNIAWGLYAAIDPQWLFRFGEMPLAVHPQIFACLGMVVGLYGVLYLEVARRPERGWLIAAVGLTAPGNARAVPYERLRMVGALWAISLGRMALVSGGRAIRVACYRVRALPFAVRDLGCPDSSATTRLREELPCKPVVRYGSLKLGGIRQ